MKKTYAEKLRDPRWQKKRLEIFARDNFTCKVCGDDKNTLHVHHKEYNGCEPWEYDNSLLDTICADCHLKEHPEHCKLPYLEMPAGWSLSKPEMYDDPEFVKMIQNEISALQEQLPGADHPTTEYLLKEIIKLQKSKRELLTPNAPRG